MKYRVVKMGDDSYKLQYRREWTDQWWDCYSHMLKFTDRGNLIRICEDLNLAEKKKKLANKIKKVVYP